MLTKHPRTHYILIKEGTKNDIKKISISKAQYELYEQELEMKKHNEFFKVHDIDTQEILFNGRANKIEGFEEIKIDKGIANAVVVCSKGERHPLLGYPDNCTCRKGV